MGRGGRAPPGESARRSPWRGATHSAPSICRRSRAGGSPGGGPWRPCRLAPSARRSEAPASDRGGSGACRRTGRRDWQGRRRGPWRRARAGAGRMNWRERRFGKPAKSGPGLGCAAIARGKSWTATLARFRRSPRAPLAVRQADVERDSDQLPAAADLGVNQVRGARSRSRRRAGNRPAVPWVSSQCSPISGPSPLRMPPNFFQPSRRATSKSHSGRSPSEVSPAAPRRWRAARGRHDAGAAGPSGGRRRGRSRCRAEKQGQGGFHEAGCARFS